MNESIKKKTERKKINRIVVAGGRTIQKGRTEVEREKNQNALIQDTRHIHDKDFILKTVKMNEV